MTQPDIDRDGDTSTLMLAKKVFLGTDMRVAFACMQL